MYKWRRVMGADPAAARFVPRAIIMSDLGFIEIEEIVQHRKQTE